MAAPQNSPWAPRRYRVEAHQAETRDVFTLRLRPLAGPPPTFVPGQFNMLYAFGHGESAISMGGDPVADVREGYLQHTIRAVGNVTNALQKLPLGSSIGVRGPFGVGWPVDELRGQDLLIVAGGLGLVPLAPLVRQVLRQRADFGRIQILYGSRSVDDQLFAPELTQWAGFESVEVYRTVDAATPGWSEHIGTVTHLIPSLRLDPDNAVALVCGPEIMMRFTVMALAQAGLPDTAIYMSLERHMQCALGFCGHCLFGPELGCRDGPVFRFDRLRRWMGVKSL